MRVREIVILKNQSPIMKTMFRAFFLLAVALASFQTFAQEPELMVYGLVRELSTRDSIPFPFVLLQEANPDGKTTAVNSNERGRYEVIIKEENVYWIFYSAPGKVTKSVQLDTRGPSSKDWEGGFGMNIDIALLDSLPNVDYTILQIPFGKSEWNRTNSSFEWDLDYMKSMTTRQKELLEAYEEAKRLTK